MTGTKLRSPIARAMAAALTTAWIGGIATAEPLQSLGDPEGQVDIVAWPG